MAAAWFAVNYFLAPPLLAAGAARFRVVRAAAPAASWDGSQVVVVLALAAPGTTTIEEGTPGRACGPLRAAGRRARTGTGFASV